MPVRIEITPILPPANIFAKKAARIEAEIAATLRSDVAALLSSALAKRSANWSKSPKWNARVSVGGSIILDLKPTGEGKKLWTWVSGGTGRHDITPKRRKWLKFESGYVPKTLPKGTFGQAGKYIGGTVFTQYVNHPGIDARNFEQDVVDEEGRKVEGMIEAAVARAVA